MPANLSITPAVMQVSTKGGSARHRLKCIGDQRVVFKVKLKARYFKFYKVWPVMGFIQPGATREVKFTRKPGEISNDFFLIQYIIAPSGYDPREPFVKGAQIGKLIFKIEAVETPHDLDETTYQGDIVTDIGQEWNKDANKDADEKIEKEIEQHYDVLKVDAGASTDDLKNAKTMMGVTTETDIDEGLDGNKKDEEDFDRCKTMVAGAEGAEGHGKSALTALPASGYQPAVKAERTVEEGAHRGGRRTGTVDEQSFVGGGRSQYLNKGLVAGRGATSVAGGGTGGVVSPGAGGVAGTGGGAGTTANASQHGGAGSIVHAAGSAGGKGGAGGRTPGTVDEQSFVGGNRSVFIAAAGAGGGRGASSPGGVEGASGGQTGAGAGGQDGGAGGPKSGGGNGPEQSFLGPGRSCYLAGGVGAGRSAYAGGAAGGGKPGSGGASSHGGIGGTAGAQNSVAGGPKAGGSNVFPGAGRSCYMTSGGVGPGRSAYAGGAGGSGGGGGSSYGGAGGVGGGQNCAATGPRSGGGNGPEQSFLGPGKSCYMAGGVGAGRSIYAGGAGGPGSGGGSAAGGGTGAGASRATTPQNQSSVLPKKNIQSVYIASR